VGNLAALGLSADVLGPLPELSAQASLAVLCWNWCDGWTPERWPLFEAFHAVPDWGALVELLQVIRDETRKTKPT
jgi:hypothetical protein